MKILLDTHIFLWSLQDSSKLSEECKKLIKNADKVFISTASMWEISIKISVGKFNDINLENLMNQAKKNKIEVLPIGLNHILKVSALPLIHRDPFDRMLVAQALSEPLLLLTADKTVASYSSLIKLVIK